MAAMVSKTRVSAVAGKAVMAVTAVMVVIAGVALVAVVLAGRQAKCTESLQDASTAFGRDTGVVRRTCKAAAATARKPWQAAKG